MLDDHGFHVVEAPDGRQALKLLQEADFDVVITDLVMPEYDGIELIRTMKAVYPKTKILAISGVGSATLYLKTARLLGAHEVLTKPFTESTLLASLRSLLTLDRDA